MIKHSDIFNYWKDKCISENGDICIEGSFDFSKSVPVIDDWGEPACWCCGNHVNVETYTLYEYNLVYDVHKIWDYKKVANKLQKCHIEAKQFGNNDNPENLFLLCRKCHENSPDIKNSKLFFRWIYKNKRHGCFSGGISFKKFIDEIKEELEFYQKNIEDINCNNINFKSMGTHGSNIVPSTIIMALVDTVK